MAYVTGCDLEAQEIKSILIAMYTHAFFSQAKQQYMISSAFINGWFLVLWNVYKLVQKLRDCWAKINRPTICKMIHKHLHYVGLVLMSRTYGTTYLVDSWVWWPWWITELSGRPHYPTLPPTHSPINYLICVTCDLPNFKKITSKSNWLLFACSLKANK